MLIITVCIYFTCFTQMATHVGGVPDQLDVKQNELLELHGYIVITCMDHCMIDW